MGGTSRENAADDPARQTLIAERFPSQIDLRQPRADMDHQSTGSEVPLAGTILCHLTAQFCSEAAGSASINSEGVSRLVTLRLFFLHSMCIRMLLGRKNSEYTTRKGTNPMAPQLNDKRLSNKQPDEPSTVNSLAKLELESLPTGLQKKNDDASASADKLQVTIDASAKRITINKPIFGTTSKDSACALAEQVFSIAPTAAGSDDLLNFKFALATINGIGAKDELEGLLAVQMMGVHNLALECLKRASVEKQTTEGMDANINRATKLLRTFTAQMEALNRHRGKINQQVVVGNVNVNEGGRAIVGPVNHDGCGKASTEHDAVRVE